MQETRRKSGLPGLWFVVLAFLLVSTVGCASWFSDDLDGTPPPPPGLTWDLAGLVAVPTSVEIGVDSAITATVTNPDAVALTYTWDGNGGTIVGTGTAVTWSHTVIGTYTISCTAADGVGNDDVANVTVTVTDGDTPPPPPPPPAGAPVFADPMTGDVTAPVASQTIKFSSIATDPDGDPITYTWTADGAGTFTGEAVDDDGVASAFWAADAAGTFDVTLTADDGTGGTGTNVAAVTIAALPTDFRFSGFESCGNCHGAQVTAWQATAHATKEDRMQEMGMGRMESCRECHAVGYDNGGYIDYAVTNQFANIQCESCHGSLLDGTSDHPGGGDITTTFDAENCGVCHTGSHHPTIDEWRLSGHGTMPLLDEDGEPEHNVTGTSCMKCHNGEWFVTIQVNGEDPPEESLTEVNDGMRIGCATCHDPHDATLPHQLRIDSEGTVIFPFDDIEVSAGAGNTCVSCHNGRRTRDNYDSHMANGSGHFGTHHGPQGPVLLGLNGADMNGAVVDYDTNHPHSGIADTCVSCHMGMEEYVDADNPAVTGHTFAPAYETCSGCHGDAATAEGKVATLHTEIDALLADFMLAWPAAWIDNSDPENPEPNNRDTDPATGVGPPRGDDGVAFREALWNYYLVLDDRSGGVHNPTYVRSLLNESIARLGELEVPLVVAPQAGYVGKDTCLGCHSGDVDEAAFNDHRHNHKLNPATSDFIGAWWTGSNVFDTINMDFGIDGETYFATIDGVDHDIVRTLGWGFEKWKQRYIVKVGNSWYITPAQHNMLDDEWVNYHTGDWDAGMPTGPANSYDRRCMSCHNTGGNVEFFEETGEWVMGVAEENVQCEACHGPGETHAGSMNAADITNPVNIADYDRQLEVCGACHGRGNSVMELGGSTMGYPFSAEGKNFQPGDTLDDFYVQNPGLWPSGHSKKHHQQFLDYKLSAHYAGGSITCVTCHDPHETDADFTNDLCTSCHGSIGADLNAHTMHATAKQCIDCHMPYIAKSAFAYDIRSHAFDIITPQVSMDNFIADPTNVIPNSCMNGGCHGGPAALADEALIQAKLDDYNTLWP